MHYVAICVSYGVSFVRSKIDLEWYSNLIIAVLCTTGLIIGLRPANERWLGTNLESALHYIALYWGMPEFKVRGPIITTYMYRIVGVFPVNMCHFYPSWVTYYVMFTSLPHVHDFRMQP